MELREIRLHHPLGGDRHTRHVTQVAYPAAQVHEGHRLLHLDDFANQLTVIHISSLCLTHLTKHIFLGSSGLLFYLFFRYVEMLDSSLLFGAIR